MKPTKCQYCDDVAVTTVGWPNDYRWCAVCQRDLAEFAGKENYEAAHKLKSHAAIAGYRAELERRQDDFMRRKVNERNQ